MENIDLLRHKKLIENENLIVELKTNYLIVDGSIKLGQSSLRWKKKLKGSKGE
jgi:hypothetical protein